MGEIQIKEGAVTPKQKPQKKIWWRVLLAFFGGFLTFPLLVVGGTAIVGTVFTTRQVVEMAGGNPDDILGAKYQSQTILQSVMTLINDQKFETLEDLNEISPLVEQMIQDTYVTLANSLLGEDNDVKENWDELWDKLKTQKFTEGEGDSSNSPLVVTLKEEILGSITLESLFQNTQGMEAIFNYFLYPPLYEYQKDESGNIVNDEEGNPIKLLDEEGNPIRALEQKKDENGNVVTDGEGNPVMVNAFDREHPYNLNQMLAGTEFFNSIFNDIVIGDIIPNGADVQILNVMSKWHINEISDKINEITIGDVIPNDGGSKILEVMSDWHLNEISTKINDVQISSLFEGDISENALLSAIGDLKVSELSNQDKVINTLMGLKLGDIVKDIPEDTMLYSFKDMTMEEIKNKDLNSFYLADLLSKETYVLTAGKEDKYNKVIGALIENERKDRYGTYKAAQEAAGETPLSYEDWLAADPENAKYKASIATLTNYDSIKNIKLSDIMDNAGGNKVIQALFDKGATVGNMSETVNTLKLEDVIEITNSSPEILKSLKDTKINELGGAFDTLKLSDVITVNNDSPQIIKSLTKFTGMVDGEPKFKDGGATVNNLSDTINTLKLSDVIEVNDSSPQIIKSLTKFTGMVDGEPQFGPGGATVNNLSDSIDTLKLSDVIAVNDSSPQIIKSLTKFTGMVDGEPTFGPGGATVNNLDSTFDNLKFNQIFKYSDCNNNILKSLWENNYPLGGDPIDDGGDFKINEIGTAMEKVALTDVLGGDVHDSNRVVWKAGALTNTVTFDLSADTLLKEVVVIYNNGSSDADQTYVAGTDTTGDKDPVEITYGGGSDMSANPYLFKESITVSVTAPNTIRSVILTSDGTAGKTVANVSEQVIAPAEAKGEIMQSITGMWWFLLTTEEDYENASTGWKTHDPYRIVERVDLGEGSDYSISNFAELVNNMEYHMKNEKLDDLSASGLVTISAATLNSEVYTEYVGSVPKPGSKKRVGAMTLTEFISVFEKMSAVISALP